MGSCQCLGIESVFEMSYATRELPRSRVESPTPQVVLPEQAP
jgi:hypothetical protein